MKMCKNCAKEMTCNKENCKFKSWIQTKNYGVPRRIENVLSKNTEKRKV